MAELPVAVVGALWGISKAAFNLGRSMESKDSHAVVASLETAEAAILAALETARAEELEVFASEIEGYRGGGWHIAGMIRDRAAAIRARGE